MSELDSNRPPVSSAEPRRADAPSEQPWNDAAAREVRGVRHAITNRDGSDHVPAQLAPMMSEFLSRLDAMNAPPPSVHAPPEPPDPSRPPTPAEFARHLRGALERIESGDVQLRAAGDGPIARMVDVGREFLQLRRESVARAKITGASDA